MSAGGRLETELSRRDAALAAFSSPATRTASNFAAVLKRVASEYDRIPELESEGGVLYPTFWKLLHKELGVSRFAYAPSST